VCHCICIYVHDGEKKPLESTSSGSYVIIKLNSSQYLSLILDKANYNPISIGSKLKDKFCLLINFLKFWMVSFSLWCMDNCLLPYFCKNFIAMKIHLEAYNQPLNPLKTTNQELFKPKLIWSKNQRILIVAKILKWTSIKKKS
jgi:hypothetical protein